MTIQEAEAKLRHTFINRQSDIFIQKYQNELLDIIIKKEREENNQIIIKPIIEKINFFVDNTKKIPKYMMHIIIRCCLYTYDLPIEVKKNSWLALKLLFERNGLT